LEPRGIAHVSLTALHHKQGVSAEQDVRFKDKQAKLLKSMKFPKEFEVKVPIFFFPSTCCHNAVFG